uniref:WASH complex subunit 4 N-terminal domain-containing protein n=1 Tax=Timema bartmani TaxID=61472 RepID=A0A7R9EVI5_9NEOP|nr:unnamed protein product [Timema bartmani]
MGGTDWDFDRSEDESQKVVGEIQLRMYGQFLEKYSLQLQEIKDALENNKRDFWDMSIDPASLQRAVEESFTAIKSDVGKNVLLAEELHLYLKISLNTLESKFTEQLDFESAELWVKLSSLYILNFNLFGTSDKRMNKQLLEFSKKIPSVTLYGNVLWYPEHFLVTHLPHMNKLIDKKAQQSAMLTRQNYLQQKSQSLQKNTQTFIFQWSRYGLVASKNGEG